MLIKALSSYKWFNFTAYLVLCFVFETQTRRSPLEPFDVVRPGLVGLKLHHIEAFFFRRQGSVGKSGFNQSLIKVLSVISNNIAAWLLQTLPDKPCSWSIHSCAPSARQAASGVVLYLLCCFSAAVNTQTGSHHAVVAELRPADLRAAQQQARQSPPYIRVYHCDAQAEQKRVSFMEEKR